MSAVPAETCARGHLWTEANTRVRTNGRHRVCRTCARIARAEYDERQRKHVPRPTVDYALARLAAEHDLVRTHHVEALELERSLGHIAGTIELVRRHRSEYGELYRRAVRAQGGRGGEDAGSTSWSVWRVELGREAGSI